MNGKNLLNEDLINVLEDYNFKLDKLDGMKFNLFKNEWTLSSDKSINYIGKFMRTNYSYPLPMVLFLYLYLLH